MAVAKVAAGVALAVIGLSVQAQSGPVACWTFDEDFRSTVGGAGLDGIPFNGASIDGSRSRFGGGSLRLRRSSQQYVRIPQSPFTRQSYTCAAWYFLDVDAITGGDRYMVLEASDGTTWPASYGLRRTDGVQAGNVHTHDDGNVGVTPSITFPSGPHRAWRHIAVTYDAETWRLDIFLDGAHAGMLLLRADATQLSPSTYLHIGSHREPTGRNWEGWIDEVAVWDRVLSHAEIRLLQEHPPAQLERHGLTGYQNWVVRHGLPLNLRGAAAVVSGDGLTNLEKYAFGLDPWRPARRGERPVLRLEYGGAAERLVLDVPRNPDAIGLEVMVEASDDLTDWMPVESAVLDETPDRVLLEVNKEEKR